MLTLDKQNLEIFKGQFALEVSKHSAEIDPGNEQDWYSLTLGWALAKGFFPTQAHAFAMHIRYDTKLA
jgi:hypothetical protein